ncbi:hypothetical protein [Rhizobium glycinendophyticum]|uniref:NYN domain-containing protein n=1 Tax=Rhizobium glycinendophyticum TaxID=2589807 RepID=A0A504U6J9_9HYPH|nr:hypothetical protein [Rhizobium glycinendophyticum]TPP06055.1 hypothetical protein FJQ55_20240 [Rhizobium glycinendophyticum]
MVKTQRRILFVLDGEHAMVEPDWELARGVAMAYSEVRRLGGEAVFACDGGGFPHVAGHMRRFSQDPVVGMFLQDHIARDDIADALSLEQIVVDDFDGAAFFVVDPINSEGVSTLKEGFLSRGRLVVLTSRTPATEPSRKGCIVLSGETDIRWIAQLLL